MAQPLAQVTVFRDEVMDEEGEQSGLADHCAIEDFAVPAQEDFATLVGIEFQREAFVQRITHQTSEILDTEPGLVVLHERVEEAVVAGEDGGGEVRGRRILDLRRHLVTSVSSWKVATNSSKNWVASRGAFEVGLLPVETVKPEGPRQTARHKTELKP